MRRLARLPWLHPLLVAVLLATARQGSAADISFAAEVAPLLLVNCSGCHDDDRPEQGFSVTTFARLMRGGDSGAAILAGKAAESLLVKKIKGTDIDGQRMPISRPPLSADLITIIERWIDQGAKLDVLSPQDRLPAIVSAGRMRSMPHEALLEVRFAGARKLWRRALPDEDPVVEKRDDLLVVGNLEPGKATLAADAAATAWSKVQRLLADGRQPLLKGGIVVFVFAKPFDYSAFWQVVLADERPRGLEGNAGVIDENVYGAFVMPEAADLEALAAEQIAAAAFLARGAPAWFASGAGRMVAMKVAPKSPRVKAWRGETAEQLQRLGGSADDYFGDRADPAAVAAIGGGFIPSVVRSEAKLAGLIRSLDAGTTFEKAFADAFKDSPETLYARWAGKGAKKTGSGRR
jgi:mono/diheme cytochrome c family protein